MIRISIVYPNQPGSRFDMAYYLDKHMPASIDRLGKGAGFKGVSVERGVAGAEPGSPPPYVALCHYLFETAEMFVKAFMPHAEFLQSDIANYTDIKPVIQFSEVAISR